MNSTNTTELHRLLMNLIRIGQVTQCDYSQNPPRVRVQCGELLTDWLPWNPGRAGALRVWAPPVIGETVILLSPSGDTAGAIVIGSLYSTKMPAPEWSGSVVALHLSDGARLHYDQAAHVLTANIPGTAHVIADAIYLKGSVHLDGSLKVTGKISSSTDVTAVGVSLLNHCHDKVKAGSDLSGSAQ